MFRVVHTGPVQCLQEQLPQTTATVSCISALKELLGPSEPAKEPELQT